MKKFLAFSICAVSLQSSAAVLAGPDNSAIAGLKRAAVSYSVPEVPAPSRAVPSYGGLELTDITDQSTQNFEVVSAFPRVYQMFPSEENSRIIRVFRFKARDGETRRLEVYFTGSDWMRYGLVYFITNAGRNRETASAYFMEELSTPDPENGSVPPAVNPFNADRLSAFILSSFLDEDGGIQGVFSSVATWQEK